MKNSKNSGYAKENLKDTIKQNTSNIDSDKNFRISEPLWDEDYEEYILDLSNSHNEEILIFGDILPEEVDGYKILTGNMQSYPSVGKGVISGEHNLSLEPNVMYNPYQYPNDASYVYVAHPRACTLIRTHPNYIEIMSYREC